MENKKLKNYRFSEEIIKELQEIVAILNTSETEAVARAIHYFYLYLKDQEDSVTSKMIIPFTEYQKTQEKLSQALYKIGELEGISKEREERLRDKDKLIEELKDRLDKLEKIRFKKAWWQFWKDR